MNKKLTAGIIVLCLFTIIGASVYQVSKASIPRSVITIDYAGNKTIVDPFSLEKIDVKGALSDGKGEKHDVNTKGFRFIDVINLAKVPEEGYKTVKVVSDDEYAAELTPEEAKDNTKTFFIIDENKETKAQTLRLIVFGDENSKRQVKKAARIELGK